MKLRKYIRKYMTVFLLLCLIFTINVVPIGAITASGGSGDYVPTSRSTFPVTVGFGYKIIPGEGQSPTMVFSNEFGGFGQELQYAQHGQDYYEFKYPVALGEPYNQQGKGVYYYNYLDDTTNAYSIPYSDGSLTSEYNFGYTQVRLNNSAFFSDPYDPTLNFMNNRYDTQQCITFKARDVVYNSHYLYGMDNEYYTDPLQAMMPSIIMFNNDNMAGFEDDNAYYVYHYTWEAKFIDAFGKSHSFSGGWYHNTRDDTQKVVPLIPLNTMRQMARYGHSFVIDDFVGVLSATYYERAVSGEILNGVWQIKEPSESSPLFGYEHEGSITTAACNVVGLTEGLSYSNSFNGLEFSGLIKNNVSKSFVTNSNWSNGSRLAASMTDGITTSDSTYEFYSIGYRLEISNWDYSNNANSAWYDILTRHYVQIEEGAPDPSDESAGYVAKGLAGMGLSVDLYYPILNTDHVVNTGSSVYKTYYDYFGFPYFAKFVSEYGLKNPAVDDYPSVDISGSNFTDWLVEAVGGFVGFELWPGFSLAAMLSVCIAIPLVLWILKLFAGG